MVHVKLAGVASTLPAGSVARTWKVWLPSASALWLCGLVQAANAAPSSLHSKVLPALVAVKLKLALVLLVRTGGLAVIVVSGAVVSMVQVKLAVGGATCRAGSLARTWEVWLPADSALWLWGLVQAANAAPSSLHSKVLPAMVA